MRKPLNQQKLKTVSNAGHLQIIPNEIIFKDVEANYTYEIPVLVRNLTKIPRRIRIGKPRTKEFKCDYNMVDARAAGIPMRITISFESTELTKCQYQDKLLIMSEGTTIELQMHAYTPNPVIVFEPFINLGFVQTGTEKVEQILFKNEGVVRDTINLTTDEMSAELTIEPKQFTLDPKKR